MIAMRSSWLANRAPCAAAGRAVCCGPMPRLHVLAAALLAALFPGPAGVWAALPCPGADPADAAALSRRAAEALAAVPADAATAQGCLRAALALGDPGAGVALGAMAAAGLAGPADPTRAAAYYSRAAEAGSPQGLLAMGLAYARGAGVPADPYWAYWFLGRALRSEGLPPQESATAQAAADAAAKRLPPADRAHLDANLAGDAKP